MRTIRPSADADTTRTPRAAQLPWPILLPLGIALAVVGWLDAILLWFPSSFGNAEWEFGTISAHFDALPLGTLGLGLIAAAAIATRSPRLAKGVGIGMVSVGVVLVALYLLYLLTLPPAWQGTPVLVRPSLIKAMIKTSVFAVVYVGTYAWIGIYLVRRPNRHRSD